MCPGLVVLSGRLSAPLGSGVWRRVRWNRSTAPQRSCPRCLPPVGLCTALRAPLVAAVWATLVCCSRARSGEVPSGFRTSPLTWQQPHHTWVRLASVALMLVRQHDCAVPRAVHAHGILELTLWLLVLRCPGRRECRTGTPRGCTRAGSTCGYRCGNPPPAPRGCTRTGSSCGYRCRYPPAHPPLRPSPVAA